MAEAGRGSWRALLALFFTSGATGLVWQTVWARQLHLVFGTSTFAVATVLTAFMAGLALGGVAAARWVAGVRRPLRVYGLLEVGIGAYAAAFPTLLGWLEPVYLSVWRATSPSPLVFGLEQLALVGVLLLPPTVAMGATLPLLARFVVRGPAELGARVGTLYAVNTGGAVAGTALCGFVLLPALGLQLTTWLTAGANVALGLTAMALDGARETEPVGRVGRASAPVLAAAAIAGFAGLVYEVTAFRVLGLLLGASVYAFTVMLLAFLVGIALGGRIGGDLADRRFAEGGAASVLTAFAAVEVGVAGSAWGMMYLLPELPYWYVWLFDLVEGDSSGVALWSMSMGLAVLVLLLPTTLMGVAFPLTVRVAGADDAGTAVASVYAANTGGGVLGAMLAGFYLLPTLQIRGTTALAATANLAAAAVVLGGPAASWARRRLAAVVALGVGVAVLAPPPWEPLMMTAAMYKYVRSFKDHSRAGIRRYTAEQYELVYYREGLATVVTVARNPRSGHLWLANNGKIDASTSYDMPTQVLVSLLPLALAEQRDDVLVIGLASGITAGAALLPDDVSRLTVAELEPATAEAARYFDAYNHGVLDDPRAELVFNDGRNHVLLAAPGTWDVIISEPSNPWLTGVSNLFTREFLELGRTRLKPGGVWGQWVQLYGMDDADLRSLIGTFTEVWPHVLVFSAAMNADLVMVASDRELVPDLDALAALYTWPRAAEQLRALELEDPADLVAHLLFRRDGARALAGEYVANTDDNMHIEHRAPLHLHASTASINVPLLRAFVELPDDLLGRDDAAWARVAEGWWDADTIPRAITGMTRAAMLRPAGDPDRDARLVTAFTWFARYTTGAGGLAEIEPGLLAVLYDDFEAEHAGPARAWAAR